MLYTLLERYFTEFLLMFFCCFKGFMVKVLLLDLSVHALIK